MAYKQLSPEEFAAADTSLQEARLALQDREEKLTAVYNQVETDMSLIGATAVEDRSVSHCALQLTIGQCPYVLKAVNSTLVRLCPLNHQKNSNLLLELIPLST